LFMPRAMSQLDSCLKRQAAAGIFTVGMWLWDTSDPPPGPNQSRKCEGWD
jgi:hypothetical protein